MSLYSKWRKVGIGFSDASAREDVDPERLLIETSLVRGDPRLVSAMVTWIVHFGDLINVKRLNALLPEGDGSVLGACISKAFALGDHYLLEKLDAVVKRCRPQKPGGFLHENLVPMQVLKDHVRANADKVFLKWGLVCQEVEMLEDSLSLRSRVLKDNTNLALRTILGAGARADILFWLLGHGAATIRRISQETGYSYEPVYSEVARMSASSIVLARQEGRKKMVSLSAPVRKFLLAVPV